MPPNAYPLPAVPPPHPPNRPPRGCARRASALWMGRKQLGGRPSRSGGAGISSARGAARRARLDTWHDRHGEGVL